ncbi:hypothetical protein NKI98_21760 [Mesorhizobium sp. M0222]|uniref:hypothetical protein n=1 Tax=Mesorhizobium sp. M0222 TaxID=2956921 RepID=UPI0033361899
MSRFQHVVAVTLCAGMTAHPVLAMSTDEACAQMAGAAESVMKARQNGIALQKVLEVANNPQYASGKDGFRAIIMMAYGKPRFNTEENKQRAIDDFRDEVQLYCMKLEN